ncbi:hypothetical protein [Nocardia sp. NBC_01388]|uniref:hypothetical protein n=1 Tax=Nocardia sp. NBC_01388 TaxID=2903596 RepID=UPI00324EF741
MSENDRIFESVIHEIGDVTVNNTSQFILSAVLCTIIAAFAIYGCYEWRKTGRPIALVLIIAGAVTSSLEAITDVIGHLFIFGDGAHVVFTLAGRPIPLWAFAAHIVAWSVVGYMGYWVVSRGGTAREVSIVGLIGTAGNLLLELPATNMGVYEYWGDQGLKAFGTFPIVWAFINMGGGVMAGALLGALPKKALHGWRVLSIIPLVPSAVIGFIWFSGWPFFVAINYQGETITPNYWISTFGTVVSIVMALVYTNMIARLLCSAPEPVAARAQRTPGWRSLFTDSAALPRRRSATTT